MKPWLLTTLLGICLLSPMNAHAKRISKALLFGQDIVLYSNGNVAIRAQCLRNEEGSGNDVLRVYASTEDAVSILDGLDEYLGAGNYLTPATLPVDSELMLLSTVTGVELVSHGLDAGMVLSLTNLRGISFAAESSVMGVNVRGGFDCIVSIEAEKLQRFGSHRPGKGD